MYFLLTCVRKGGGAKSDSHRKQCTRSISAQLTPIYLQSQLVCRKVKASLGKGITPLDFIFLPRKSNSDRHWENWAMNLCCTP